MGGRAVGEGGLGVGAVGLVEFRMLNLRTWGLALSNEKLISRTRTVTIRISTMLLLMMLVIRTGVMTVVVPFPFIDMAMKGIAMARHVGLGSALEILLVVLSGNPNLWSLRPKKLQDP